MEKQEIIGTFPTAGKWVKSPLRNRLKLELNAPINEVWATVGDPAKILTHITGLNKVEMKTDGLGKLTEYTCFYYSSEDSIEAAIEAKVLWHEAHKGWAALDEEPNDFGFQQSLTLLTVIPSPKDSKIIFTWDMHYNNESDEVLQVSIPALGQVLSGEIAPQLINKFGGSILESYAYGN